MSSIAVTETLRPFRHPKSRGRLLALVAAVVPICVVALGLALDGGRPAPAIALTCLTAAALAAPIGIGAVRRIRLSPDGAHSRQLTRERHVPIDGVARVVVRRVRSRDEVTSSRLLFLVDEAGRPVLRMSSRWWTEAQMNRVAGRFSAPVDSTEDAVSMAELRRSDPVLLRWRHRHPWIWAVAQAILISAACLVIAALANAAV